mmetsp:Transcript_6836/g.9853  ORF Transcript_6836/g.9853 Transcript_6836/m.9853 type:complete len:515 (+) Transcript_6836:49-1593(+)
MNNMSSVALPRFMPASQNVNESSNKGNYGLQIQDGNDLLDFNLLAEYLLDDGANDDNGMEFGIETPPATAEQQSAGIVSPEQSEMYNAATNHGSLTNINTANYKNATTFTINNTNIIQTTGPSAAPPASQASLPSLPLPHSTLGPGFPQPISAKPMQVLAPMPAAPYAPIAPPIQPSLPNSGQSVTMTVHQHKRLRIEAPGPVQKNVPMVSIAGNTITSHPAITHGHIPIPQILSGRGGRQKSQAQIDRRRERNRILARRTRLRKKFFFESLQKDVTDLQKENLALREIVRTNLEPEKAKTILDTCKAQEELPRIVTEHCGDLSSLDRQDFNLVNSVQYSQQCFVITDPSLQDNPIVYASDGFLELTGYSRENVLGRNCRFLQGAETNKAKIAQIAKSISMGEDVSVTFINYAADGTPFWNKLFIAALRDAQNNIVNYIGVSVKVVGPEGDDPEAGKVLPGQEQTAANQQSDNLDVLGDNPLDADAAVMAIEGAVDAAVAAAPKVAKKKSKPRK